VKLTIDRAALLTALAPAVSITDRRAMTHWGSCVVLRASTASPALVIASTRDYTSVRSSVDANVSKPGTIAVPAEDFASRVDKMPDGEITLTVKDGKLTLKNGAAVHVLRTLSVENYPAYPTATGDPAIIDAKSLATLLGSVSYAVEKDNPRGVRFAGIVLATRHGKLVATASDGLGRFSRASAMHAGGAVDTFIPYAAMAVIDAAIGRGVSTVSLAASERTVGFTAGSIEMAYIKPDIGELPYDTFFQSFVANDGTSVSRRDLAAELRGVTPDGMAGLVQVVMRCEGDRLTLSHTTIDGDESTREMQAGGGTWQVRVEAAYLRDALRVGDDDVMLCEAPAGPLVIRSASSISLIGQCVAPSVAEKAAA
jgi:DNA polymerase III sliding clamp (beta) subunit (PCNA family)